MNISLNKAAITAFLAIAAVTVFSLTRTPPAQNEA